jgi:hypothetical protein
MKCWTKFVRLSALTVFFAGASIGAAATDLTVRSVTGSPAATVNVPIDFSSSDRIVALQFEIVFDPARIAAAAPVGGMALANHWVVSSDPSNGVRRVVIYSLTNAQLTNGVLVQVPFTLSPDFTNGATTVTLAKVLLVNSTGAAVSAVNLNPGQLTASTAVALTPARLKGITRPSGGSLQFQLEGSGNYALELSTNLTSWTRLSTNSVAASPITINDNTVTGVKQRFYRAISLP